MFSFLLLFLFLVSPVLVVVLGLLVMNLLWRWKLKPFKGINFSFAFTFLNSPYNFLKQPRLQIELAQQYATPCSTPGHSKYSGFWSVISGHMPFLCTMDTEIVKQVYVTQSKKFGKIPSFRTTNYHYIYSSKDIFTEDTNDYWKRLRSFMNPAFSDLQLKNVFESSMEEMSDRLVAVLKNKVQKSEIELQEFMDRFSFEVICAGGFGNDIHCLDKEHSHELQLVKQMFTSMNTRTFLPYTIMKWFQWIPYFSRVIQNCWEWRQFLQETINDRKKEVTHHKNDLLSKFISVEITDKETRDTADIRLNNEELIACSHMVLGAGEETSANTLGWVFHFLASYPQVQAKVRQEIQQHLGSNKLTFELYETKLEYTKAVIKETLRLRGPAFSNSRCCLEDCTLVTSNGDKVVVPKGCNIYLAHSLIHEDTQLWGNDAQEFKPERFLDSSVVIDPYKYCPFGAGQRSCIGKRFAELEMVMCTVKMVSNFQLQLPVSHQTKTLELPEVVVFTSTIGECHVQLQSIDS